MMNKCLILVDNSNVFIEGRKQSARVKGVRKQSEQEKDPYDPSWRLEFGGLLNCLANGRVIQDAILVGSRPPKNDSVWDAADANGFQVIVHNRDSQNREKAVDTELVAQGSEKIVSASDPMVLVIASGDRDFLPLVNLAHRRGWEVEMCAFSRAFNPQGEMATAVDRIRALDPFMGTIGRCEFEWPTEGFAL